MTNDIKHRIGERIADEVEKVAAGRQSNCEQAAEDILAMVLQSSSRREAAAVGALRRIEEVAESRAAEGYNEAGRLKHIAEIARSALQAVEGGEGREEQYSSSRDHAPTTGIALDGARVREIIAEGDGLWRSCSGCLELEDGQNVHGYPYSAALGCTLGGGCGECGGLGAIWDTTDYAAMGAEIAAEQSSAAQVERESSRDEPLSQEPKTNG